MVDGTVVKLIVSCVRRKVVSGLSTVYASPALPDYPLDRECQEALAILFFDVTVTSGNWCMKS